MTNEVLTIILTGVSVTAGVLLGVWRMMAHYETRNDAAHAELGRRIDGVRTELGRHIDEVNKRIDLVNGRIDLVYQELVKSRI